MPDSTNPATFTPPEFLRDLGWPVRSRLESRRITVDGLPMHSRSSQELRDGVPFVLIHGLVISSLYMIPLAECLAVRHTVHALDLPGFGRSPGPHSALSVRQLADAVIGWMSAGGIMQAHLVANSLGCEIAAHVAVKAPERVVSLALIGPTLDPDAFAVATQTGRLLQDAMHEPARLWGNWIFDFFRAGIRRAVGTTRAMFRDHIEHQLPSVQARALVIRGGKDPTVPQGAAELMAGLLPSSTLLVIDGQPHCVHYTEPQRVCDAVERHAVAGAELQMSKTRP